MKENLEKVKTNQQIIKEKYQLVPLNVDTKKRGPRPCICGRKCANICTYMRNEISKFPNHNGNYIADNSPWKNVDEIVFDCEFVQATIDGFEKPQNVTARISILGNVNDKMVIFLHHIIPWADVKEYLTRLSGKNIVLFRM